MYTIDKTMLLSKVCVALLVLIARTCRAEIIIPTLEPYEASMMEAVVNILTSCYNNTYGSQPDAVVLLGDWPEIFLPALLSQMLVPVVSIDSTKLAKPIELGPLPYKLRVIVTMPNNFMHFMDDMIRLIWLNPYNELSFLIVVPLEQMIVFSNMYMGTVATLGQTKAKLILCVPPRQIIVVAINPYTSYAPKSWQFFYTITLDIQKSFTSFMKNFGLVEGERICEQWDFDMTQNLAGSKISIITQILPKNLHIGKGINSNAYHVETAHIFNTMYRYWNATPLTWNRTGPVIEGMFLYALSDGNMNFPMIISNRFHMWNFPKVVRSYAFSRTGLVVMTKFRGHKSQLEKILCVVDKNSRIGLCLVLLLTVLFFKFFVGQPIIPAFLNVVRIVCDTGFERLPLNAATRLYVTAVLLFAVTMQGIYQGNLASLLTHHVPVRNIDTMEDLAEIGGKIYGHYLYKHLFADPVFKSRYVSLNYTDCVEFVLNDSSAACVGYPHVLMDQAKTIGLHLTPEYIVQIEEVFLLSFVFPLKDKFNMLLLRMVETDIIRPLHLRVKLNTLEDFRFDREVMNDEHHKPISLDELAFAFAILAIGLVCALIAFIAEVGFFRFQNRKVHVRVQNLNLRQIRVAEKPVRISI